MINIFQEHFSPYFYFFLPHFFSFLSLTPQSHLFFSNYIIAMLFWVGLVVDWKLATLYFFKLFGHFSHLDLYIPDCCHGIFFHYHKFCQGVFNFTHSFKHGWILSFRWIVLIKTMTIRMITSTKITPDWLNLALRWMNNI